VSKRPYHPWLETPDPTFGERLSDADPPQQGIFEMPNGDMVHVPPAGSIPHVLSQARNSGNASTRDTQAAHEAGRKPLMPRRSPDDDLMMSNGQTRAEQYRDEKSDYE
jgi:hypothetical protein